MNQQQSKELSNPIIQLCSDDFLKNFSGDFLSQISLIPWSRKMGTKDNLNLAKSKFYLGIIVDADLSYSKKNIISWARVLADGGLLILESSPYKHYKLIESMCSATLEYVPNKNDKVWIYRKKSTFSIQDMNQLLFNAYKNSASDNEILDLVSQLEQHDCLFNGLVSPLVARLNIYKKYNLQQLIEDECQLNADRLNIPNGQMVSILYKLCCGDEFYKKGFAERKIIVDTWAKRTPTPPKEELSNKRWNGESLKDKTIVMWTEFGLGDEIMFSQLAYYFKTQGAKKVILITQPAIIDLIKTSIDIDEVILSTDIDNNLGEFDYWTYPHDILIYTNTLLSKIRKRSPYLFTDKEKVNAYSSLFKDTNQLKIGIVWRGNRTHENDSLRSIHDLNHVENLFNIPNIDWYCFQKECTEEELALLEKYKIPHITKHFSSFLDTASAMEHLDYLITVDTSSAHVAGAIGVPILLLLPHIGDWRWGVNDSSSMWYPNVEIFRCDLPGPDWNNPINELKQYLINLSK